MVSKILYSLLNRASKLQAFQTMSTMLSTRSTEHAQQRVQTDWTPIKGDDSEEDVNKTEQN